MRTNSISNTEANLRQIYVTSYYSIIKLWIFFFPYRTLFCKSQNSCFLWVNGCL